MSSRTSTLLINESPLQALPSLAAAIGLNQAIILQQIHYWMNSSEHKIDGYIWIYNSYDSWAKQFKWLTPRAIQKHVIGLEKMGLLITKQFKYKTANNTKWYRINYDKLEELQLDCEKSNSGQPKSNSHCEKSNSDSTLFSQSLRLNSDTDYQENTHKTNNYKDIQEIWVKTLEVLRGQISLMNFNTWFQDSVGVSFDGELFVIGVKNEFTIEHLKKNQRSLLQKILTDIIGVPVRIDVVQKVEA